MGVGGSLWDMCIVYWFCWALYLHRQEKRNEQSSGDQKRCQALHPCMEEISLMFERVDVQERGSVKYNPEIWKTVL